MGKNAFRLIYLPTEFTIHLTLSRVLESVSWVQDLLESQCEKSFSILPKSLLPSTLKLDTVTVVILSKPIKLSQSGTLNNRHTNNMRPLLSKISSSKVSPNLKEEEDNSKDSPLSNRINSKASSNLQPLSNSQVFKVSQVNNSNNRMVGEEMASRVSNLPLLKEVLAAVSCYPSINNSKLFMALVDRLLKTITSKASLLSSSNRLYQQIKHSTVVQALSFIDYT